MAHRGYKMLAGFTLTELLTTLAVIAIVLSAGVPGVRQFISDNRRAAQINYMLSAFERARSEAMRTTRVISVCPSRDGASCAPGAAGWQGGFIVFANAEGTDPDTVDRTDDVLEMYAPVRGAFTLRGSGAVTDFVAFGPDGVPFQAGEFAWCDSRGPGFGQAVILHSSGKAFVSKTNAHKQPLSCTP